MFFSRIRGSVLVLAGAALIATSLMSSVALAAPSESQPSPALAETVAALVISERSAGTYVQRVMNRLGLHNRAQVAARAVEHGRLDKSPPLDPAR